MKGYTALLFVFLFVNFAFAAGTNNTNESVTPYSIGFTTVVMRMVATLKVIAPQISILLIILSGITYAFSLSQPADSRGKMQSLAIGLLVGGIIVAAFAFAADAIERGSEGLLTSK